MKQAATISKIAIYARVSTKANRQDTESQLITLREYAAKQGWDVVAEYVDHETGRTDKRAQFQQMFTDASKHQFDLVLFWALDRFSREGTLATLEHLKKLSACGVYWRSHQEAYIDSCGPFSDVVIALMATLAHQESIRRGERALAGVAKARRKGTVLGRKKKMVGHKHSEALRLHAEGLPLRQIGEQLGVSAMTAQRMIARQREKAAG